jgi:hypothetical protein
MHVVSRGIMSVCAWRQSACRHVGMAAGWCWHGAWPTTQRLLPAGKNAFDGYVPSVPQGEKLDYASDRCNELETLGAEAEQPEGFMPRMGVH